MFVIDGPVLTERLVLRPFESIDLDALSELQSRPEVVRYLYYGVRTRAEVAERLADRMAKNSLVIDGDSVVLAVLRRDTGTLIGDVMLELRSQEWAQGEVGYVFHPDHGGQGYATEAARAMLALGFDRAGLHRIIGRADARNAASARVLRRLGMRHEATFRHSEFVKDEWCDEVVYAILADEWAALA